MKIRTDAEGRAVITQQLCDADLRLNGIVAFQRVGRVLQSIQMIKPEPAATSKPKPEKVEQDKEKDKPDQKGDKND